MTYYDPFLDQWLTGASGQVLAQQSETDAVALNALLTQIYTTAHAATADTAGIFQTTNFALTGTYNGTTVPENVALICAWTLMCSANNIHPDDAGHAEVALAFEQVIDTPPPTAVIVPSTGSALSGSAPVDALATDTVGVSKVVFTLTGGSLSHAVVATGTPTLYGYLAFIDTTADGQRHLHPPERGHRCRRQLDDQCRSHRDGRQHATADRGARPVTGSALSGSARSMLWPQTTSA